MYQCRKCHYIHSGPGVCTRPGCLGAPIEQIPSPPDSEVRPLTFTEQVQQAYEGCPHSGTVHAHPHESIPAITKEYADSLLAQDVKNLFGESKLQLNDKFGPLGQSQEVAATVGFQFPTKDETHEYFMRGFADIKTTSVLSAQIEEHNKLVRSLSLMQLPIMTMPTGDFLDNLATVFKLGIKRYWSVSPVWGYLYHAAYDIWEETDESFLARIRAAS
jgi:hypothetical protein